MDVSLIGSYIITFVGIVGFRLAGKKVWWAWYVNIANQALWAIFAVVTQQWGFLFGTVFYLGVFIPNAYSWTKEHLEKRKSRSDGPTEKLIENRKKTPTKGPEGSAGDSGAYDSNTHYDIFADLYVNFKENDAVSVSGTLHGKYVYFYERYGRWSFGYGDTPNAAMHRRVISGELRDRLDSRTATTLTRRLAQVYVEDTPGT